MTARDWHTVAGVLAALGWLISGVALARWVGEPGAWLVLGIWMLVAAIIIASIATGTERRAGR